MRRPYDDLLRLMEQDLANPRELFWRFMHATAPDKFWEPLVDVYETRTALKIKVELSGVRREDIQVELAADGKSLRLRGLRLDGAADVGERTVFHQMEIYTGPFERTIQLPASVTVDGSDVEATYQDGFLVIDLPKQAPRATRTRIQVQG